MCNSDFRRFLVRNGHPLSQIMPGLNGRSYTDEMRKIPLITELLGLWDSLRSEPFKGISSDGAPDPSLYELAPSGAPVAPMVAAAERLLAMLADDQKSSANLPLDAPEWRVWHNMELVLHDHGLRLEHLDTAPREAIFDLLRASLSDEGYARVRNGMRMNQFLGDCLGYPNVLGEFSYTFCIFGTPHASEPWGWHLFGHHLALNCLVVEDQMVIGPVFYGAEPTAIDVGPHAGLRLFTEEEATALALMRSLSPALQADARLPTTMATAALAPSPLMIPEQRHLAGAFRDNRVIPYAGALGRDMDEGQREMLLAVADCYIHWLPDGPRRARRAEIERFLDETRFAWIGGTDDNDPFYYRLHSPVLLIEFDHHFGAHLTNQEPARFHIHTVARLPNGNDFGKALLAKRADRDAVHVNLEHGSSITKSNA